MTELVETNDLTKSYPGVTALAECNLRIGRGEVFGLLGPNGSGKTTLLRLLMGFLRPTSGTARVDGLDCYRESVEVHRRLSYLPGDVRLFGNMRGDELLRFFSRLRRGADLVRERELAGRLGLDTSRLVSRMSTGMRQKLALATVMSIDVPLVILDEPTSNLDPNVRGEVRRLVGEAREAGRSVIFSSHVLDEVEQSCDRVGIMRAGRLVYVQALAELRRQHRIRARLTSALPAVPDDLAARLRISAGNGDVTIDTPGDLSPLLGWLATLPLAEVHIEPIGLRAAYDRFHGTTTDS